MKFIISQSLKLLGVFALCGGINAFAAQEVTIIDGTRLRGASGQLLFKHTDDLYYKQEAFFKHYFQTLFKPKDPTDDANRYLLSDLIRLQSIIQDPERALLELQDLELKMEAVEDANPDLDSAAVLDAALTLIETENFFPDTKIVPLGLLKGSDFVDLIADGFVLRDLGAPAVHGDSAHRLQWAMIMSDYKKYPDKWIHPPFELFTLIGETDKTLPEDQQGNLWGHLFDYAGIYLTENGKVVPDGFRHPDRLTAELRGQIQNQNYSAALAQLTRISSGVKQKYDNAIKLDNSAKNETDKLGEILAEERRKQFDVRRVEKIKEQLGDNYEERVENRSLLIHKDDIEKARLEKKLKKTRIMLAKELIPTDPDVINDTNKILADITEIQRAYNMPEKSPISNHTTFIDSGLPPRPPKSPKPLPRLPIATTQANQLPPKPLPRLPIATTQTNQPPPKPLPPPPKDTTQIQNQDSPKKSKRRPGR